MRAAVGDRPRDPVRAAKDGVATTVEGDLPHFAARKVRRPARGVPVGTSDPSESGAVAKRGGWRLRLHDETSMAVRRGCLQRKLTM